MDEYIKQKNLVVLLRGQEAHNEIQRTEKLKQQLLLLQIKEKEQNFPRGIYLFSVRLLTFVKKKKCHTPFLKKTQLFVLCVYFFQIF